MGKIIKFIEKYYIFMIILFSIFLVGYSVGKNYNRSNLSQSSLCEIIANDYLNNMTKKYNITTFGEQERIMAVDVETDIFDLCMTELNESELSKFKSTVSEKYGAVEQ